MTPDALPPAPAGAAASGAALAPASPGRAAWSGLLCLRLVAVPVRAYAALAPAPESRRHQLHAGCGRRLRHPKHCPLHGEVDAGAVVPGYAYAPGRYLVLDEAELDRLRPTAERGVTLEHAVDPAEVDPAQFEGRAFHLLPDGPAARPAFAALAGALRAGGRWLVGRAALPGGRRHPVAVRPLGRLLALHVLHHPCRLRGDATLQQAAAYPGEVQAEEARLAAALLDACAGPVPWADYRDDEADRLAAVAEARLRGQGPDPPALEERPVLTLLEALRRSVTPQALGATLRRGRRAKGGPR